MTIPMPRFQLYISHPSAGTLRILEELVSTRLGGQGEIEVIDVSVHPERAEQAGILVTPTIDNPIPLPGRRVMGRPQSVRQLAQSLGLPERLPHDPQDP